MTVQWADIVTGTLAGIPLGAFLASHLMRNLKRAWNGQAEETGEHIRMEVSKVMGEVESKILSRIETSTLKDPRDAGEEIRQSLEQILADLKAELEWHRDIAELIAQDRNYTETANIGFTKDGILNTLRRLEEKRIHLESFKKNDQDQPPGGKVKTHRHWYGIPSFKTGFLGFVSLLLPVFAPVFLFFLALDVLIWYCWTIETKDAIFRFNEGVLARHNYWIPLEEIQSAVVDQTLVGRLLGFGTLTLIGVSGSSLMLDYVPSPRQWQEALSPRGA